MMRSFFAIFASVAFCVAVSGIDTTPKNTFEKNILNLLTKWRAGDKGPFSFPLPSLDLIEMPEVSGKYEGYGAKISFATSALKLSGLKSFSVENLDASESKLLASGTITVPSLTVTTDFYDIKGKALWFVTVKGSGKGSITFKNNQVKFSIRLQDTGTRTRVDSLLLEFKIGSVKANLENGPAAINTLLNNSGTLILRTYYEDIVTAVRDLMVPVIDKFLEDISPQQLFRTIAEDPTTAPNAVLV